MRQNTFPLCLLISMALVTFRPDPSQAGEKTKADILSVIPFAPGQVRLLDGPFKVALERTRTYLRSLETDRLLHTFRLNAGLPSTAQPLGGWEAPNVELRGHFIGHYLTACALLVAGEHDQLLKRKADTIVAGLAECQARIGGGYLSAYPESFIDRVETGQRVWAPWYTLHKIMAGLLDMYTLASNTQALGVVERMADWAKKRTDRLDDRAMQSMLKVEFGGMNDVLRNLYAATGNQEYLTLARRFDHAAVLDPLANHEDKLKGLHVNTQIPKIIGAAREYELSADRRFHEIATYFWDEVVTARSYATGGTSYDEHWETEPYRLSGLLGQFDHETCCTYNLLKLTNHLFAWEPRVAYADYFERALFNGILPVQHPETGMTMYYVPMGSGWYKTFGTPRESFWCCTGTGVEIFGMVGGAIYFHNEHQLYVNQYVASHLSWTEKNVEIRQDTRFPEQQGASFRIKTKSPIEFDLALRVPLWVGSGGGVKLNGTPLQSFAAAGSYLIITRKWKNDDRIEIDLPMDLHLSRLPDNQNRAAIMYGPVVLAGDLGDAGVKPEDVYGPYGPWQAPVRAPFFVTPGSDLHSWIVPVAGKPLTFRTQGAGNPGEVTLLPFFRLFDRRYALYWDIYTTDEWAELRDASDKVKPGMLDSVLFGNSASESEHEFQGFGLKRGEMEGRGWISTSDWFKVDLAVPAAHPTTLQCIYTAQDSGKAFDITVDGRRISFSSPPNVMEGKGVTAIESPIPLETTLGKKKVSVIFRVGEKGVSKKLLGCSLQKK
jgi:uncharacterized protein